MEAFLFEIVSYVLQNVIQWVQKVLWNLSGSKRVLTKPKHIFYLLLKNESSNFKWPGFVIKDVFETLFHAFQDGLCCLDALLNLVYLLFAPLLVKVGQLEVLKCV